MLQVMRGDSPVLSAMVTVEGSVELNNGSVARVEQAQLLDNGHGGELITVFVSLSFWSHDNATYLDVLYSTVSRVSLYQYLL